MESSGQTYYYKGGMVVTKANLIEEKTVEFTIGEEKPEKQDKNSAEGNIQKEIKKKIDTIDLTRKIRIRLSERLK